MGWHSYENLPDVTGSHCCEKHHGTAVNGIITGINQSIQWPKLGILCIAPKATFHRVAVTGKINTVPKAIQAQAADQLAGKGSGGVMLPEVQRSNPYEREAQPSMHGDDGCQERGTHHSLRLYTCL